MKIESKPQTEFTRTVARYYDSKRKDFNFLLAQNDGLLHHHNGICAPETTFSPNMTEEEILQTLHQQENALVEFGMQFLGDVKPSMLGLDAGCGRGGSTFMIHKKFGVRLVGVNISPYQVKFAHDQAERLGVAGDIKFILGDLLAIPVEDGSFDFILACESTEHIPNLPKLFSEFSRVARPDCKLLIIAWCVNSDHAEALIIAEKLNTAYVASVHSRNEYLEGGSINGWELVEAVDLTPRTIPYWCLRERSVNKPGTESFMSYGFKSGALEYHLFKYQKTNNKKL